jgi:hypothetical protein
VIGKLCQSRRYRCPTDLGHTGTHHRWRSLKQIAPFRQAAIDISAMPDVSETRFRFTGTLCGGRRSGLVESSLYLFVLAIGIDRVICAQVDSI